MRFFNITVNGKTYQVQVEETAGAAPTIQSVQPIQPAAPIAPAAPTAPVAPTAPIATPSSTPPPAAATKPAAGGGDPVLSPMPGVIVSVAVKAGQAVKKYDVLCVLEAMKMENEIVAERDGTVAEVLIKKGDSVSSGDGLIILA